MHVCPPTRVRMAASACSLVLALLAAAIACSPLQRHTALEFVFDGVPPYRTPEERARDILEAAEREATAEMAGLPSSQRRRQPTKKLARFAHGPFAANECARCHDLTTASGFRGLGGGTGSARSGDDLAQAGRLRMPIVELCVHCHTDFTNEAPANDGLWIHGPVASGWCVVCHEPHSSRFSSLLAVEPTAHLCSRCHLREDLVATAEHRPIDIEGAFPAPEATPQPEGEADGATSASAPVVRVVRECTNCHNPHMGSDRLLLRPGHERESPPPASGAERDVPREGSP